MPNQNLKPDFRYLIRFLQGCHFAMFRILTWQPCKHSLDHISDTIHPISKFLFAKSTIFFILNPIQTVKCPYLSRILQGYQIPHFHLATLERLVRSYLSRHSSDFQISFSQNQLFFQAESEPDSGIEIPAKYLAG